MYMSSQSTHSQRRNSSRSASYRPAVEQLETRDLCAVVFQFNYSLDSERFFNAPERIAALEQAGRLLSDRLGDTLSAIQPSSTNQWAPVIANPATGSLYQLPGSTAISADQILVFVGGRNLPNGALGVGGPGGYQASGSLAWLNTIRSRGEPGALTSPATDFAPALGHMAFDTAGTNWHFGAGTSGLNHDAVDFLSVAVHELAHVLGIGTSASWDRLTSTGAFSGSTAAAVFGGSVPLDPTAAHWAEGTQTQAGEAAMDPTITVGTRKLPTPLDWAALLDIGWEVVQRATIDDKYAALGGLTGVLGAPISEELTCADGIGRYRHYEGGSIYWRPTTGAFEVHGAIRDKWLALGADLSVLGCPISDVTTTADGVGRYTHFQYGSIYWTETTGAFEVHGTIRDRWARLGWERGILGYPISDVTSSADGLGRYAHFQNGSIYWSARTGAFEIRGAIRDKWIQLGAETGFLGYPISSETLTTNKAGTYVKFQNGAIYWSPKTGAREVHGAIRAYWDRLRSERSWLGFPTSDEYDWNGGRRSDFQFGYIFWSSTRRIRAYR
jgi:hypothetical protein